MKSLQRIWPELLVLIVFILLTGQPVRAQSSFQLVQSHSGVGFTDNWTFYSGLDVNNTGNVVYVDQTTAEIADLALLNSAGNYILKADNMTSGVGNATFGRNSVKLLSDYTIYVGNLVIIDAVHLPYGCSVWPAFWSQGPVWPDDGEIDIIEGVNLQANNRMSLHTLDGCTHPNVSDNLLETGTLLSTDCFNQTDFDEGCLVEVPGNSYGANFAANGGGAYALNWNTSGLFLWFWPRGLVPSDAQGDSPNPDGWGEPVAAYPSSSCDFNTFFSPQTLILDVDICGNFAGDPAVFTQTCQGTCTDLVQIPSNYDQAYFEISFIKVFQQTNGSNVPSTSAGSAADGTASAPADSSPSVSAVVTSRGLLSSGPLTDLFLFVATLHLFLFVFLILFS